MSGLVPANGRIRGVADVGLADASVEIRQEESKLFARSQISYPAIRHLRIFIIRDPSGVLCVVLSRPLSKRRGTWGGDD
jgi:hypothetical protein